MTIGMREAARRAGRELSIALAVESDRDVADIYQRNVHGAQTKIQDLTELFDGDLGARLSACERKLVTEVGDVSILLGGPPCQGHSDLNNHTRRSDPKNALYLRMARAAEVLAPSVVVIENVAPVQWDQSGVVQATTAALERVSYSVAGRVLDLRTVGVPQRRRRFVLLASRMPNVEPKAILDSMVKGWGDHQPRTVDWAIRDLLDVESDTPFDTPSQKSKKNARRMAYLFEKGIYNLPNKRRPKCHRHGGHSYASVYGRLRWNQPAQTITTGYGSMGQGRYVHPQRRRTITPHEAARLQTFPDWFDFGEKTRRGVLAKTIGNAVPPLLMVELGRLVIAALDASVVERKRA
jgi:DNA (cytosine-5)-methyltransferase 1